jgi:ABC-type nitrate/sulfonate/bicarbonate transport system substrate-binding protein
MRTRRPLLALATATTIALATGCAGASAGTGDDVLVMTVAAPTVTDFDDYVAKTKGFYEAHGVTVERVQTGTAAQSVQLLATGDAEIGRGLANSIQARLRTDGQLDFVDIADPTIRPPHVMNSKGIHDLADLAGTTMGITSVTDQGTIVTAQVIQRLGLDADSIEMVPTGGTGSRLAAMNAGGVGSSLLLPPVSFTAEKQGAIRLGYVPELLGPDYQFSFTGIIVRESWAEANREQLVRYLAARDDALRWLHDPANAEEAAQILARETRITLERATQTYDLLFRSAVPAFADRIGVSIPAGESVLQGLRLTGHVRDGSARIEDFVDDSYAAAAREATS